MRNITKSQLILACAIVIFIITLCHPHIVTEKTGYTKSYTIPTWYADDLIFSHKINITYYECTSGVKIEPRINLQGICFTSMCEDLIFYGNGACEISYIKDTWYLRWF